MGVPGMVRFNRYRSPDLPVDVTEEARILLVARHLEQLGQQGDFTRPPALHYLRGNRGGPEGGSWASREISPGSLPSITCMYDGGAAAGAGGGTQRGQLGPLRSVHHLQRCSRGEHSIGEFHQGGSMLLSGASQLGLCLRALSLAPSHFRIDGPQPQPQPMH